MDSSWPRGALALGVLAVGCAAPSSPAAPSSSPAFSPSAPAEPDGRGAAEPNELRDREWGPVSLPRFFVSFELPDRGAWQLSTSGSWDVLSHDASGSELRVRGWRAERVVNRDRCEAEARSLDSSLPRVEDDEEIEERFLGTPDGFDTVLRAGVSASSSGVEGVAIAVGANVRKCLALVFLTRQGGPGAERRVAERLRLIADGTFARARNWDVSDRVEVP